MDRQRDTDGWNGGGDVGEMTVMGGRDWNRDSDSDI